MRIGYARVSTDDQTLDLQIDALTAAGCERIYKEHASGKGFDRPELKQCLNALRSGDTLVVWRLDRLGRSIKDLINTVNQLEGQGIGFCSVTEHLDTSTPAGKFIFHVFASLAEFERNVIRERTNAGLQSARARGRVGGRPQKLSNEDKDMICQLMRDDSNSPIRIAKRFKVSKSTVYKTVRERQTQAHNHQPNV